MSAVNPPPVPKAKPRKSDKKGGAKPNNKGFFVTEQEWERSIARAERDAINNAASKAKAAAEAPGKAVNTAVRDLPGKAVSALSKPFKRVALGAGGVVLILFALSRIVPAQKVAGAAVGLTPAGGAAKVANAAKAAKAAKAGG